MVEVYCLLETFDSLVLMQTMDLQSCLHRQSAAITIPTLLTVDTLTKQCACSIKNRRSRVKGRTDPHRASQEAEKQEITLLSSQVSTVLMECDCGEVNWLFWSRSTHISRHDVFRMTKLWRRGRCLQRAHVYSNHALAFGTWNIISSFQQLLIKAEAKRKTFGDFSLRKAKV